MTDDQLAALAATAEAVPPTPIPTTTEGRLRDACRMWEETCAMKQRQIERLRRELAVANRQEGAAPSGDADGQRHAGYAAWSRSQGGRRLCPPRPPTAGEDGARGQRSLACQTHATGAMIVD